MGATTWLDRITDETNVWLSAVKAEEANDFQPAATLYLNDAVAWLGKGSPVRAALSCSCAADCLTNAGVVEQGKRLYFEAGVMYSEIADARLSNSIRESLWALQRAYECFVLAEDVKEAEAARENFELLAKRANPFAIGASGFELPDIRPRTRSGTKGRTTAPVESPLKAAIDVFLALRLKQRPLEDKDRQLRRARTPELELSAQESIVSQLG
ncbi:MAG TPA: hypothetical protein VGR53_05015 [Nitrososphaerales archaeon]|nr:hypothetical protein [Nitrososphaerales archaeon]